MIISTKDWNNYIKMLAQANNTCARLMTKYVQKYGFKDRQRLIEFAHALALKYGEASAALSAEMYDEIAEMSGKNYDPAVMAADINIADVAKTINGILKTSQNPETIGNGIGRLVKRQGADTMLKNALRDKAQFAWIPSGDTCAFCLMLASRGWQNMSTDALQGGHAEHIHANCNCNYAVRFSPKDGVEGYNPDIYAKMFENTEGDTWQEKINTLRRESYAQEKEKED